MRAGYVGFVALLAGCGGGKAEIVTMEGFDFGWDLFNHRVSHLEVGVDAGTEEDVGQALFAVVGGTSTTGVVPPEPVDPCQKDTCGEFPYKDEAAVGLRWARALARGVNVGQGEITLQAGAAGANDQLVITLPEADDGAAVAWISHLSIDTDHLTSDGLEHCYDPGFGWHPRRMAAILGEPSVSGDTVTVDVSAFFEAGESLEDERACIDEINELAVATMVIGVTVAVGNLELDSQDVTHGIATECGDCPFTPNEQPAPTAAERPLELATDGAMFGWSALDWRFHAEDPENRGGYVRTLSFDVDVDSGLASGHATNYSPATQLSGFEYTFAGTVRGIGVNGEITRGRVEDLLAPTLDANGVPVVTSLPL